MASKAPRLEKNSQTQKPAARRRRMASSAWLVLAFILWAMFATAVAAVKVEAAAQWSDPVQSRALISELSSLDALIRHLESSSNYAMAGTSLRYAAVELQQRYSDWVADVTQRLSADVASIPGCTIQSATLDEMTACNAALKGLKKDYRASVRLINKTNRLESISQGKFPIVLGVLLGVSAGVVILLSVAFAVLRRGEARRFGGVLTSHPLRSPSTKVLFAISVVVLVISLVAYFAIADNSRNPRYEQLMDSIDAIDSQLAQLRQLPSPEGTQPLPQTVSHLRVPDLPVKEVRSQINELEKSVREREDLVSQLLRNERESREVAADLHERLGQLGTPLTGGIPSRADVDVLVSNRISAARSRFRSKAMVAAVVSAAAVVLFLGLLNFVRHRRWDDHKRRGSYGGWE